jgi:hypothetical protein
MSQHFPLLEDDDDITSYSLIHPSFKSSNISSNKSITSSKFESIKEKSNRMVRNLKHLASENALQFKSFVDKFGNSHKVLTYEQERIYKKVIEIKRPIINLFWKEKILVILDYLQIFGVIWNMANPWPWPYIWITWSKVLVLANIDLFSYSKHGSLGGGSANISIPKWGMMEGYLVYALIYSLIPFLIILSYYLMRPFFNTYGTRRILYRNPYMALVMFVSRILYLPATLAVSRIFYCEGNTGYISI